MGLLRSLQTALGNLRANKLRSALTMLGVIIGVSAVIIMVSIVEGARSKVVAEFERLGSSLIIIVYAPEREESRKDTRRIKGMTMDDVRAIREQCDLVQSISAELPTGGDENAHYRDRETQVRPSGVQPDYSRIRNVSVARGRFISDEDIRDWSKVVVIGDKVREQLFRDEDPIGKNIEVRDV